MIWPKIKAVMVKGANKGTLLYQNNLNTAADIFLILIDELKIPQKEVDLFNYDEELTEALLNRGKIKEILGK